MASGVEEGGNLRRSPDAFTVANFDIAGAADLIVTFANELFASQSARQAEFNLHDRQRTTAYFDRRWGAASNNVTR